MKQNYFKNHRGEYQCHMHEVKCLRSSKAKLLNHLFSKHLPEQLATSGFRLEQYAKKLGRQDVLDAFKEHRKEQIQIEMKREPEFGEISYTHEELSKMKDE